MRAVLYSKTLEPITIIELTDMEQSLLERDGVFLKLLACQDPHLNPLLGPTSVLNEIAIHGKKVHIDQRHTWVLWTDAPINVVKQIDAIFLPGHETAMKRRFGAALSAKLLNDLRACPTSPIK